MNSLLVREVSVTEKDVIIKIGLVMDTVMILWTTQNVTMMMVIAVGITLTLDTALNANVSMKVNFKVGIGDVTCK